MSTTTNEYAPTLRATIVQAVDKTTHRARVILPELNNMLTDWLPVLVANTLKNKDYRLPDVGEHVAALLDANGDSGFVLGAFYSDRDQPPIDAPDKRHTTFSDGAMVEYDRQTHTMTINLPEGGTVNIMSPAGLHINAPAGVTIVGTVTVHGDVIADGISLKHHRNSGVRGGGDLSGPPTSR